MTEIDEAIRKVENLYRTVTGHELPELSAAYAPIPAERDPAEYVQEQIETLSQLLGSAFTQKPQPGAGSLAVGAFVPPVGAWEDDAEFVLCVDLPGVPRDSVEVSIQGNQVVISGRRPPPASTSQRPRVIEQRLGAFRRPIPLPIGVRGDQLAATLRDGVLVIRIPREAEQSRSIPVA